MEAIELLEAIPSLLLKLKHKVDMFRHLHHCGFVLPCALHDGALDALVADGGYVDEAAVSVAVAAVAVAVKLPGEETRGDVVTHGILHLLILLHK
jgi:hypothetical protein